MRRSRAFTLIGLLVVIAVLIAPSSGTLTVGKQKVSLKSEGDALVTPTGPPLFAKTDVDGVLSVDLDGKPVSIPLGVC